jgi:hypothetical protein
MLPFKEEFDDLFREDRSIWWKILGGAAAAALAVLLAVWRGANREQGKATFGPAAIAVIVVVAAFLGALVAVLLSLKDVVRRRMDSGQRVSRLLRVYFGGGAVSLMVWVLTVLLLGIPAIIVLFGVLRL